MGMHANPATSSGLLNADTAVSVAPAQLHSVQLIGDGTNTCQVTIYDNASAAAGRVLAIVSVDAGLTYENFLSMCGVEAQFGLYADVSGTGAQFIVHFSSQ